MPAAFYDAHNHLQDERLLPILDTLPGQFASLNIKGMVVNGSCESDWPKVAEICKVLPGAIPSYGYHPWYVRERTSQWQTNLLSRLDSSPSAVGEIGLDRWQKDYDAAGQEDAFVFQWKVACERALPITVHCLQAWGWLTNQLEQLPRPQCGFVLHSYGGSRELIPRLTKFGAYFSFPGYFAHERKKNKQEVFKHVPLDRLLIETDAPDQLLPPELDRFPLNDAAGKPANHPANIVAVYEFAAALLHVPMEELALRVENNFLRVFGKLLPQITS